MKLLGIIGDPVDHSLSPWMQNAALRQRRLSALYLAFQVTPRSLGNFLKKIRRWPVAGLNVTIPLKEKIIPYLDAIDRNARRIGAVNTIIRRGRRLIGTNTDAAGYLRSLQEETDFRPRGKKVLILGAGGAARAVFVALADAGVRTILVANRTPIRATRLIRSLRKSFPLLKTGSIPLRTKDLRAVFPSVDLLVNATSAGLPGSRLRGIPLKSLKKGGTVSDLVPSQTPFLQEARSLRLRTHGGLGMLLHQGALSFKQWTGRAPNLKTMRRSLESLG